jgi:hypothetical protein
MDVELFMINKDEQRFVVINNYFFNTVFEEKYEKEYSFFVDNAKILDKKQFCNFYFNLPFQILHEILDSIESGIGAYLTKTLFIPRAVWYVKI